MSVNVHILLLLQRLGQEKITEDAFNKGANYYIMKPFNNRMLLERIKFGKMTHGTEPENRKNW